MIIELLSQ